MALPSDIHRTPEGVSPRSDKVFETFAQLGEQLCFPFIDGFLRQADIGGNIPLGFADAEEFHNSAVVRVEFFQGYVQLFEKQLVRYKFGDVNGVGDIETLFGKLVQREDAACPLLIAFAAVACAAFCTTPAVADNTAFFTFLALAFCPCWTLVSTVTFFGDGDLLFVDRDVTLSGCLLIVVNATLILGQMLVKK